jgi:hypothetical protein
MPAAQVIGLLALLVVLLLTWLGQELSWSEELAAQPVRSDDNASN